MSEVLVWGTKPKGRTENSVMKLIIFLKSKLMQNINNKQVPKFQIKTGLDRAGIRER